ncbi:MAG: THxN family PEP-CTERM protein [Rheinheimera sp.]|nr:THxN family PEP-CTERM protein [Rheinheimera sp.]
MKFKTLLTVSALSIATFVGSVQAAIIPAIEFGTQSGWLADGVNSSSKQANGTVYDCAAGTTDAANGCGLTFSGASGLTNAYTDVSWGVGTAKSSLNILSQSGTLVTNGAWVQTGLITHSNKTIPAGTRSLYTLDLSTLFTLISPPLGSKSANVGIKFNETPNVSNPANCPIPQLSGALVVTILSKSN